MQNKEKPRGIFLENKENIQFRSQKIGEIINIGLVCLSLLRSRWQTFDNLIVIVFLAMLIVCNRAASCSPSFPWKLAGPIFPLRNPRASPHISHIHEDQCHRIDLHLHPHHEARRRNRCFSATASLVDDSSSQKHETSSAILWFKKDLRVDDHPGLLSASANFQSVLPVYIFDPYILRG